MELSFRFRFWTFYRHLHVTLHRRNKIYPNWTTTERVMALCRFFKMAAIPSQIYLGFLVLWRLAFRKAKNYLRSKFRPDTSIHGEDITTSGCQKQTSAIFKFYSRFRRTLYRHRYVILHWPAKFCKKQRISDSSYNVILIVQHGGYSVVNLLPVSGLATYDMSEDLKLSAYQFRSHISMHYRDITTSGLWKQRAPYWYSISGFDFDLFAVIGDSALAYQLANRIITNRVMTSYWFHKMAAIGSQIYFRFLIWPCLTFRKVQSYRHTKFRPDIPIHGRDIASSDFWKRSPYWNSTSGLDFDLSLPSACGFQSVHQISSKSDQPYWFWFKVMVAHPRSASGALCFFFKFRLDRFTVLQMDQFSYFYI